MSTKRLSDGSKNTPYDGLPPTEPAGTERTVVRSRNDIRPQLADQPPGMSGSLIGLKLGEYDVIAQLGAGGMGIVYRGMQPQIGKTVAIKVLKPEIASGEDSVQALLSEARAVNSIRHPGIVDIFSFGSTPDGRAYVVMELLEGASLDEVLREVGHFSPLEAIGLLEQIVSALDAAHSAGVIHRDLKPANIHLTPVKEGGHRVKLLDFGLAKLTAPGTSKAAQTHQNVVRGTPEYMSPEQATAQPVSAQTDLYAVGVLAFELVTGALPFTAASPVEFLMQHISAAPPLASTRESSVPPELDELIERLLEKNPADRPESAASVGRQLGKIKKALLAGGTVIRRQPTAPASAARVPADAPTDAVPSIDVSAVRRSNTPLVAGLVALVVLLAGGVALSFKTDPPPAPKAEVVVIPEPTTTPPAPVVARPEPTEVATPTSPTVEPKPEPKPEPNVVHPVPSPLPSPTARPKVARVPTAEELLAQVNSISTRLGNGPEVDRNAVVLLKRYRLLSSGSPDLATRKEVAAALDRIEADFVKRR